MKKRLLAVLLSVPTLLWGELIDYTNRYVNAQYGVTVGYTATNREGTLRYDTTNNTLSVRDDTAYRQVYPALAVATSLVADVNAGWGIVTVKTPVGGGSDATNIQVHVGAPVSNLVGSLAAISNSFGIISNTVSTISNAFGGVSNSYAALTNRIWTMAGLGYDSRYWGAPAFQTLTNAVTSVAELGGGLLVLEEGRWPVTSDFVWSNSVGMYLSGTGCLHISDGKRLTTAARVWHGRDRAILSNPSRTALFRVSQNTVYPEWWGAKVNDNIPDETNLDSMIRGIGGDTVVEFAPGTYDLTGRGYGPDWFTWFMYRGEGITNLALRGNGQSELYLHDVHFGAPTHPDQFTNFAAVGAGFFRFGNGNTQAVNVTFDGLTARAAYQLATNRIGNTYYGGYIPVAFAGFGSLATNITVRDCKFVDLSAPAVFAMSGIVNVAIQDNVYEQRTVPGMSSAMTWGDSSAQDDGDYPCFFWRVARGGVAAPVADSTDVTITGNRFRNVTGVNTSSCFLRSWIAYQAPYAVGKNWKISDNFCQGGPALAYVGRLEDSTIDGNMVVAGHDGIQFYGTNVAVRNNRIQSGGTGIKVSPPVAFTYEHKAFPLPQQGTNDYVNITGRWYAVSVYATPSGSNVLSSWLTYSNSENQIWFTKDAGPWKEFSNGLAATDTGIYVRLSYHDTQSLFNSSGVNIEGNTISGDGTAWPDRWYGSDEGGTGYVIRALQLSGVSNAVVRGNTLTAEDSVRLVGRTYLGNELAYGELFYGPVWFRGNYFRSRTPVATNSYGTPGILVRNMRPGAAPCVYGVDGNTFDGCQYGLSYHATDPSLSKPNPQIGSGNVFYGATNAFRDWTDTNGWNPQFVGLDVAAQVWLVPQVGAPAANPTNLTNSGCIYYNITDDKVKVRDKAGAWKDLTW